MDEGALTQAFFEWQEAKEADHHCNVQFESASESVLRFMVDGYLATLDFDSVTFTCKNGKKQGWTQWCQSYLSERLGDLLTCDLPLTSFLDKLISKYEERPAAPDSDRMDDEEEGDADSDDFEELDYKASILTEDVEQPVSVITNQISLARVSKKRVEDDMSDVSETHFVFRHAEEGKMLLETWLHQDSELAYSMRLTTHPGIAMVKLELDLSFLDLSEESLDMLGLTLAELLTVNVSYRRGTLVDTCDFRNWTTRLFKDTEIECMQGTKMDSFGCKEYVPGLVKEFLNTMSRKISAIEEGVEMPSASLEGFSTWEVDVDARKIDRLIDMGYSRTDSVKALHDTANNLELAIDSLIALPKKKRKQSEEHRIDWIQEVSANVFYNLLFSLREAIMTCTKHCLFCYRTHPLDSFRLRACSEDICEFRFDEIAGFSVFAELRNRLRSVQIDVSTASIAAFSGRSLNIFEPFPSFLLKNRQVRGKSGFLSRDQYKYTPEMDQNKDIQQLQRLISLIPNPEWLLASSYDEKSLRENILSECPNEGRDVYKLLRYIIATNRLSVLRLESDQCIPALGSEIQQYIVTSHSPELLRSFTAEKEQNGSFFAFHGSAIENWYSIIRNGLRNMSSSHLMTAGAAYGSGIYAAEDMSTSLGYCGYHSTQGSSSWRHNVMDDSYIMAIIEVIKKPSYQHGGIYVIPEDKHVIIRYLLIFRQNAGMVGAATGMSARANEMKLDQHLAAFEAKCVAHREEDRRMKIETAIAKAKSREETERRAQAYFEQQQAEQRALAAKPVEAPIPLPPEAESKLKALQSKLATSSSSSATKRLLSEFQHLSTSKDCVGISVSFLEDNLYTWLVSLDINKFETPAQLKSDFQLYSNNTHRPPSLDFEVRFSHNFPFSPPFLRIVRPRFAFHTGHVTVGGSICMQSLTPSGWIPVRTVESVFIEILFNMGEGGARLDLSKLRQDYSLEEAEEAFTRVAKQHNWL